MITLLEGRGMKVDSATEEKIRGCHDTKKLEKWLIDAATADSAESLFAKS